VSSNSPERDALLRALAREARQYSTSTVLFHQVVAERLGLNPTDHKVAELLSRTGPLTAGELAEHTGLTTGAITGVVDRLERGGFVRRDRDPEDRRRVIVQPTWGTEKVAKAEGLFASLLASYTAICESYSDAELRVILDFMERCRAMNHEEARRLRAAAGGEARGGADADRGGG
jgi:DNA-binding MarR family transcriptional regulator